MDLRKRRRHPVDKLPLLTTRWRRQRRAGGELYRVMVIKVAHTAYGRSTGKWVNYARYLYELHHGPVPAGKRVFHRDGDLTNFALDNLVLGSAADALWIHCHSDAGRSAANYAACRAGSASSNRERAAVRRQLAPLPTLWYPVDLARRVIVNRPGAELHEAMGAPPSPVGRYTSWRLGWPHLQGADASLLAAMVRCHGPRSVPHLADNVARLRGELLIGPARLQVRTLWCSMVRLVKLGLAVRAEPGRYEAHPSAAASRGPVCPYAFLTGKQLAADPYRWFEFAAPAAVPAHIEREIA